MIPDEAVEAAARVVADREGRHEIWDYDTETARAALEAAAPHLLAPVLKLAEQWEARGESDMAFSKTVQDEDIAIALLTDGATMVENARHIRNAVEGKQ